MSDTSRPSTPPPGDDPFRECICMGLGPELTRFLRGLGPPEEAWRHVASAGVEVLKALRVLIDQRIETLNRQAATADVNPTPPPGTSRR
jgi:hypothetical protein